MTAHQTANDTASSVDQEALVSLPSNGAEAIAQVLADEGIKVIFGDTGSAISPVFDAVFGYSTQQRSDDESEPMTLVGAVSEQGAGFMAAGYARASGKVGVTIVTSESGATNIVTPVQDSMADSVPLVVICIQASTTVIGRDAIQEAPASKIMRSCAKHVFLVTDASLLETTLRTAFTLARSGRPGPVVVDVAKDVQIAAIDWQGLGELPIRGYRTRLHSLERSNLSDDECATFFTALMRAQRPLIYAGGGVIAAAAAPALRAFVDAFGLPVTTTLMGVGAFDTTNPKALHMLGMHGTAYANYAVQDCDFLLALGARFDDRVAGAPEKFAPRAKFIAQIDIDPSEIGKVKPAAWHHVGPMVRALTRLTEYGMAHAIKPTLAHWDAEVAALKHTHAMDYDRTSSLIQPYAVIEAINRHAGGRAIVSTGVGQHQMWAAQYFDFRTPRQWLTSGSMGTMGFGLPAAIGAQFAHPEALVIDIDGDSSIRMNICELETVIAYRLPLKIVVLNNVGDGMVKQWQNLYFKSRFAATDKSLHKKNFVLAAQADGFAWAHRLERNEDLESTLSDFLSFDGPAFLEVMIDRNAWVYPMVGPGASYAQMVTGDFIASRVSAKRAESGPSHMF